MLAPGVLLVLLALGYAGWLLLCTAGVGRAIRRTDDQLQDAEALPDDALPSVTVLIPARDEAATVEACVRSVLASDYPADRLEVLVIDDFSTDGTAERVRSLCRERVGAVAGTVPDDADEAPPGPVLRLLPLADVRDEGSGHKHDALAHGLAQATGELILTTDADCEVPARWVRTLAAQFTPDTGFVTGPVTYAPARTPAHRLQALELLGLLGIGAGTLARGRPTICSSANVAYRRALVTPSPREEAFVHPGSDELMAQTLAAEGRWRVRFCAHPHALVTTRPEPDLAAFWRQRARWAGSGARFPGLVQRAWLSALYLFYVLLLAGFMLLPAGGLFALATGIALGLKVAGEGVLLHRVVRRYEQPGLLRLHAPGQFVQIPYVVLVTLAGVLWPTMWKGRRVMG